MKTITLRVKNMVCSRCIKVVREELERLGWLVVQAELGQVVLQGDPDHTEWEVIKNSLEKEGFELLADRQAVLIEKVKIAVLHLIYSGAIEHMKTNFSDYIAAAVARDYHSVSALFSAVERMTIEKYFILQKIERAKELLSYNEFKLREIARKLGYSNVAHLSNQFKRIVGCSPIVYRKENLPKRKGIDRI